MIDSLVNSIAGEVFTPEGITHPSMNMPHAQMVLNAYGYKTRTWVGLTLDDIPDDDTHNLDFYRGGRWAERILKEKNT